MLQRIQKGFTLIELLVAISIMGILAAIVLANLSGSTKKGRDAERQADLRNLQNAVEAYKQKNGKYPNMGNDPDNDGFSSEDEDPVYIQNIAPTFITNLPHDSVRGSHRGYSYLTDGENTTYKIAALDTVESESVTDTHPFKRCSESGIICGGTGVCNPTATTYKTTYAVWGGFANGNSDTEVKNNTKAIICK